MQRNKAPGRHLSVASQPQRGAAARCEGGVKLGTGPCGMRRLLALEFFMTPVFHLKNKNNLVVEQILGDHTERSTGCLHLAFGPTLTGAVTTGSGRRLGGCSSFPSPCSRGLEALATNEMGRNKQKNKVKQTSGSETVLEKLVMLSCSLGTNVL